MGNVTEMWTIETQRSLNANGLFKFAQVAGTALIAIFGLNQSAHGYVAQSAPAKTSNVSLNNAPSGSAKPQPAVKDLPRADFIKLMDAEFKNRDLDSNGKATRIEVEEFTKRTATAKAQEQNRLLFEGLDADRNGVLSPSEFSSLVPAPKFMDVSAEMLRFDSNRDQIITLVEYRTATLINFDRMDADKDGILSASELSKLNIPLSNGPTER
jgi:Ca2+-binding EF-hand superfamily protein